MPGFTSPAVFCSWLILAGFIEVCLTALSHEQLPQIVQDGAVYLQDRTNCGSAEKWLPHPNDCPSFERYGRGRPTLEDFRDTTPLNVSPVPKRPRIPQKHQWRASIQIEFQNPVERWLPAASSIRMRVLRRPKAALNGPIPGQ